MIFNKFIPVFLYIILSLCLAMPHAAQAEFEGGLLRKAIIAKRLASQEEGGDRERSLSSRRASLEEKSSSRPEEVDEEFDNRAFKVYVPSSLPRVGERAMVVVLHGGGANASFMQATLDMNAVADKYGFLVAYLNGTAAGPRLPSKMKAWNAGGGCCGKAYDDQIDDIGYISSAVNYLNHKYGVEPSRVFALGHSNGAIMSQMMICKTNVFQATVPVAGPLSSDVTSCPAAQGKRVLAIHGELDENVPIIGGVGTKGPNRAKKVNYRAEASAKELFERYGASYTIDIVRNTDHSLQRLDDAVKARDGYGISEKAAQFFGLAR